MYLNFFKIKTLVNKVTKTIIKQVLQKGKWSELRLDKMALGLIMLRSRVKDKT
jgi:hypothetical protein